MSSLQAIQNEHLRFHLNHGEANEISGANRKAMIVRKYLNTKSFSKVRFFDDDRENLKAFLRLSREYPAITFEAYRVIEDGEIRVFRSI